MKVTKNLPWFVKDPATALIGQTCYHSLVERLDIKDADCVKFAFSKALGLGIVVGGSIVKVPQVLLIISANSARGLSLTAYVLETLSYAISLAYSYRNGFAFSTYGENLFLTIQNVLITVLIIHHMPSTAPQLTNPPKHPKGNPLGVAACLVLSTVTAYALAVVPAQNLALLQMLTLPLGLFSKLPQIAQNYTAQSTGQLSAFAVIAQVAGCVARIFTTATEVGDPIVQAGFVMGLVLNLILAVQMWMYWGRDEVLRHKVAEDAPVKEKLAAKEFGWASGAQPHVETAVPAPAIGAHPERTTSSPAPPGRRWARKVD
ncbi:mannose-P-dolichol utilization defect 1 protein [Exidia glandulosa HHB12029]|uniref:Mannose-P-dolichol utilization defect 1 protein n=1 Tax=Exidia glandulosa HHB12029 TaxID=1314781 RepID=A0A165IJ95_EXIGL|nr:mannose-P-dolichol utilization defect 1 protein [Exidia glandulosa HHB12029]